jgi:hypothetical protein
MAGNRKTAIPKYVIKSIKIDFTKNPAMLHEKILSVFCKLTMTTVFKAEKAVTTDIPNSTTAPTSACPVIKATIPKLKAMNIKTA